MSLVVAACGGGGSEDGLGDIEQKPKNRNSTSTTPVTTQPVTTTPTAPDTSVPVSDRAPLGVNLEGLWDWARLLPFVDLMKTARPWGTADAPWDEAAPKDAQGWPTTDAGVVVNVRTFEPGDENKAYRYMTPGTYKLKFTGRATVSSGSDIQVTNYTYDAATNRSQADLVLGQGVTQMMLAFRNTTGGVKDVSVRQPGYDDTQTFTNQFTSVLAPFQVLRAMDFLRTNNNPVRTWAERTTPASAAQTSPKGAAVEYVIQMANEMGKDIWVNVPFGADDDYVRSLAQLLKQNLAPGRAVYVEYSNELWNFMFQQSKDNMNAAVAEAVAGDTTLTNGQQCTQEQFAANSGECNSYWAGYYRVGKKAVGVAQIFSEVYGSAAMNSTVRVVYATQFANPGIAEQVLKNIAKYRVATPNTLLYGVATAPYFYLPENLVGSTTATKDEILLGMEGNLAAENLPYFAAGTKQNGVFVRGAYTGSNWSGASHKALADYYGMKSLAYEGGPDLGQNAANGAAKIAANRDAKMGELVKNEVSQWFGCGNDLFMYFSISSAWDKYGYWGLTNDVTDLSGPKMTAARDVAQSTRTSYTTCK